jgi:ribulose-phosphate 3-epimerase
LIFSRYREKVDFETIAFGLHEKTGASMRKISASILSADFGRLAEQVRSAEQAGVDWIHVDVMDGHFVPNITIGPDVTRALRKVTGLPLDVHLMISNPERYVEAFARAGADWLGIHVEATVHLERLIQQIKETGAKATVTLNPATPLNCLEYVLKDVDMVLLMTVNPGFSGQNFIRGVLPKVRRLRQMIDEQGLDVLIQVDGGVSTGTAGDIAAAGADVLVSGSGLFNHKPVAENVRQLRELMK